MAKLFQPLAHISANSQVDVGVISYTRLVNTAVDADQTPDADATRSLGTLAKQFQSLYVHNLLGGAQNFAAAVGLLGDGL